MAFLPDTSPYWNVVDRTRCYPLRKLEFEGRRMNFPGNIEEMLTNMYGDFMQLPPVEDRVPHHDIAYLDLNSPCEIYDSKRNNK